MSLLRHTRDSLPTGQRPVAGLELRGVRYKKSRQMEDKMAELEVRLAFQDELLDALNGTVARQQKEIDLLQQQIRLLYQQLKGMQSGGNDAPSGHEIPPHY